MKCPVCKNHDVTAQTAFVLTAARVRSVTRRQAVLNLLTIAGPQGLTVQELAKALGAPQQSISARVTELSKAEAVIPHGVRETHWKRKATVWVIPHEWRADEVEAEQ